MSSGVREGDQKPGVGNRLHLREEPFRDERPGAPLMVFSPDAAAPNFEIRVRAQRFSPDMFYVNEFADRLRQHNAEVVEELFR